MPPASTGVARNQVRATQRIGIMSAPGLPKNATLCYDWVCNDRGEVTERLKVLASKASVRETVPWVRIPPSPPFLPWQQVRFLNEKAEHFCPAFPVSKSCPGSEVAGGHAALLQVLLVILFGAIKGACGRDLCGNGPLEFPLGIKRCP